MHQQYKRRTGRDMDAGRKAAHARARARDGGQSASTYSDAIPVIGTGKGIYETFTGKDPITGNNVNRWVAGGTTALGILPFGKVIGKAIVKRGSKLLKGGDKAADVAARQSAKATTEQTAKQLDEVASSSGVDFVKNTGALGGTRATTRQINAAQSELADLGIGFNRNFKGNGGSFSFGSSPVVSVPKHPTQIQLFHELTHARQYGQLGREGYIGLGKYARESHVFNNIWKNRSNFNRAEVKDAINYQRSLRSQFNRGAID